MEIDTIIKNLQGGGGFTRLERQVITKAPEGLDPMELITAIGRKVCPAFRLDDDNRKIFENLRLWVEGRPFTCWDQKGEYGHLGDIHKGVYLAGPTGTGKSVALDVMREYARAWGVVVRMGCTVKPLAWRTCRADDICDRYAAAGSLSTWKSETVLCIQDLGTEPMETLYMGNRVNVLRSVIEYRGDRRDQLTLVSSNYSMQKAGEIYGKRVGSRLAGMCNYFVLKGDKKKQPIKSERKWPRKD